MSALAAPEWDVVVVGGGTAGLTAARAAAQAGARVALIEREPLLGGECTFVGCVPSKTLIEVSRTYWAVRQGAPQGIRADGLHLDFAQLMRHKDDVIADINRDETIGSLEAQGIAVLTGAARFVGPNEVAVGDRMHRYSKVVIATGSAPSVPRGLGFESVPYLTNETVFALERLPRRLAVVGGGPIGLELGQAFGRFGSEVTVLEGLERLLVREEPEAGEVIERELTAEGMNIRTGATVTGVRRAGQGIAVHYSHDGTTHELTVDAILVATGRAARVAGLGLDVLGVTHDPRGIAVDRQMRTTAKDVYAAGDVTGQLLFTHVAAYEGRIAGQNAAGRKQHAADYRVVPWVTFLDPEVARVGLTEKEARAQHRNVEVLTFPMSRVDRARIAGAATGFVKLVTAGRRLVGRLGGGKLVGAHIVGPHAGEMLHEAVLAMRANVFVGRIAQAIHAYPTASVGLQQAASQAYPIGRVLADAREYEPVGADREPLP